MFARIGTLKGVTFVGVGMKRIAPVAEGRGGSIGEARRDVLVQATKFFASLLEFILLVVSYFAVPGSEAFSHVVIVSLSALSLAVSNEVELFESGPLYPMRGNPPRIHVVARLSVLTQGVAIAISLFLLALVGTNPTPVLPYARAVVLVLAFLVLPQVAVEFVQLTWNMGVVGAVLTEGASGSPQPAELAQSALPVSVKRDVQAYGELWQNVIFPLCDDICGQNPAIHLSTTAKEDIWEAYVRFNAQVSHHYMRNPNALIDRHKVAACYSYAVLEACPLWIDARSVREGSAADYANERLAMALACSIVAAELRVVVPRVDSLTDGERRRTLARLDNGLVFPKRVGHGDYVQSVLVSLRHTRREDTFNVLQYALLIFHWERCTFGRDVHHKILGYYRSL